HGTGAHPCRASGPPATSQREARMNRKALVVVWAGALAVQLARGGDRAGRTTPKTGGTDNDPLIQLELEPLAPEGAAEALLTVLNQLPWASRTAVLPRYAGAVAKDRWHPKATAAVAVGERQWADVADLVNRVRKAGFRVSAVRLTQFGTVRIRTQFDLAQPGRDARESIAAVYRRVP